MKGSETEGEHREIFQVILHIAEISEVCLVRSGYVGTGDVPGTSAAGMEILLSAMPF